MLQIISELRKADVTSQDIYAITTIPVRKNSTLQKNYFRKVDGIYKFTHIGFVTYKYSISDLLPFNFLGHRLLERQYWRLYKPPLCISISPVVHSNIESRYRCPRTCQQGYNALLKVATKWLNIRYNTVQDKKYISYFKDVHSY